MTTYAGDPDNFPESVEIIDDGEYKNAASANVPDAASLDRTAWLRKRLAVVSFLQHTDDDSFDNFDTITADTYTDVAGYEASVLDCEVGDLIVIQAVVNAEAANVAGFLRLSITEDAGGGSETTTAMNQAKAMVPDGQRAPYVLQAAYEMVTAGPANVFLQGRVTTAAGGNELEILGPQTMILTRYGRGAP